MVFSVYFKNVIQTITAVYDISWEYLTMGVLR